LEKHKEIEERIRTSLKSNFKPEFINRIDEIIVFHQLSSKDLIAIADLNLQKVAASLASKKIKMKATKKLKELLVEECKDLSYGARPLKRIIEHKILDPISQKILNGDIQDGFSVTLDAKDGKIDIKIS